MRNPLWSITAVLIAAVVVSAQVTRQTVPGVTNFAALDTTLACAGATAPSAIPEIKKLGYKSVINLRLASEPGADIDGEAAAAKTAGLAFYNLPFNSAAPDGVIVERFLDAVSA